MSNTWDLKIKYIYKAEKCHFRQSGKQFWQKFHLYATRQLMVALCLDSVTYYPLSKIMTLHPHLASPPPPLWPPSTTVLRWNSEIFFGPPLRPNPGSATGIGNWCSEAGLFYVHVVPSRCHRTIIRWLHAGITRASRSRVAFLRQSGSFVFPSCFLRIVFARRKMPDGTDDHTK